MSKEEKKMIKRCQYICDRNDKEDSTNLIKKEYPGCSVSIHMTQSKRGKMFMGMMLYKNFNISF